MQCSTLTNTDSLTFSVTLAKLTTQYPTLCLHESHPDQHNLHHHHQQISQIATQKGTRQVFFKHRLHKTSFTDTAHYHDTAHFNAARAQNKIATEHNKSQYLDSLTIVIILRMHRQRLSKQIESCVPQGQILDLDL